MAGLEMKDVTRKVNEFMLFEVYLELLPQSYLIAEKMDLLSSFG